MIGLLHRLDGDRGQRTQPLRHQLGARHGVPRADEEQHGNVDCGQMPGAELLGLADGMQRIGIHHHPRAGLTLRRQQGGDAASHRAAGEHQVLVHVGAEPGRRRPVTLHERRLPVGTLSPRVGIGIVEGQHG